MSNAVWIDLDFDYTPLKMHDLCGKSGRNCQKLLTFPPQQNMLGGRSIENEKKKKHSKPLGKRRITF